jgi:hypothetical protein
VRPPRSATAWGGRSAAWSPGAAPAQIAQVPGRKTDVNDAAWIGQLLECGLIRANSVPPPPIRDPRDLTRYRKLLIQERTRHANRLHKVLARDFPSNGPSRPFPSFPPFPTGGR